ncbi:MAG: hypothetical protein R2828_28970 [Saprospiraceae bacterium]
MLFSQNGNILGQKYSLLFSTLGLVMFFFVILWQFSQDTQFPLGKTLRYLKTLPIFYLLFIIGVVYLYGWILGGIAGKKIVDQHKNYTVIGILTAIKIVILTALTIIFLEGIPSLEFNLTSIGGLIKRAIASAGFACIIMFIPATILGGMFGLILSRKSDRSTVNR